MEELRERVAELHESAWVWACTCCEGDRAEAEDVLQASYLKLIDGRATFSGRSSFKTWLFGVIRNTARERRRRSAVRRALLFQWWQAPDARRAPDEQAELTELERAVHGAMRGLSERQRAVIELVFFHDLTVEESADVMGVSVGTARTHYARGKDALRGALAAHGGEHVRA